MIKIIRAAALIFLFGSLGYYVWYGLTDQADNEFGLSWVGPQMVAPIIALSLVPMVFAFTGQSVVAAFSWRNSSEFRDGSMGVGTVTSVRPTGMSINDQPEVRIDLDVEDAQGRVFSSHARMVVTVTELPMLRPGVVLPVRYLPHRPDKVEIDRSDDDSAAQDALNQLLIRKGITTQARLDIVKRGITAQAVVQAVSAKGEIREGNPRMNLTLSVTRPNGTTFGAEVDRFMPATAVARLQVGKVVQVHYLPGDESEVVVSTPMNA
ncbi:DUF3592 domain-containing protein [Actinoalloteichus hymeniacidonis]|uniref:Uncharacterized protein n=1 Tax=Actinoalloteichus hymeniacidonis TaxID=340345 RepID=A0AAC9HRX1_9PSEU|nr:DUF3592 domain-containing protein [Actinoalloteichus hymeniacidonis]AOS63861.1 hypothetical protein TL08_15260 [Actinoalloteichus hymeniacidonis]MBB5908083.1 hypothetical protein [Actinoalloteichus hymeniacidonis]